MTSCAANQIDVFFRGGNSKIYHRWYSGNTWMPSSSNYSEDLGGTTPYEPVSVAYGSDTVYVFMIGMDSALYYKVFTINKEPGTKRTCRSDNWDKLGGSWLAPPAAVAQAGSFLELVLLGQDRAYYQLWFDGKKWGPFTSLGGTFKEAPTLNSWGPDRLDIFGLGIDGNIYHKWWTKDGSWGPKSRDGEYNNIGGPFFTKVAACSRTIGNLDLFVFGRNGAISHNYLQGNNTWKGWDTHTRGGGWGIGVPTLISSGPSRTDLFFVGKDRAIYYSWVDPQAASGWQPPEKYENLGAWVVADRVSAVSWGEGKIDLFHLGTNLQLYHRSYENGKWAANHETLSKQVMSVSSVASNN